MSKTLIRGVNWIGDSVMSMPAVRAMRKAFTDERISIIANANVLPLFENNPNIDEIIRDHGYYENSIKRIFRHIGLLKKESYARAILFQNAFGAALTCLVAGIPVRIGYNRDGRGLLLTTPVSLHGNTSGHQTDYYLSLLRGAGLEAENTLPWIFLSLEERIEARERLGRLKRPVVAVNPGAAFGSAKRWPTERFAKLIETLIREEGASIILSGSQKEREIAENIKEYIKSDISDEDSFLDLSGKTSLRELCALLSECDALVTNDSGPMHISYAVGTPLVALFGSTDPLSTGPPDVTDESEYSFLKRVLKKDMECAPCFARQCRYGHLKCLNEISVDEVVSAIREVIAPGKAIFFDRDGTLCKEAHYLNRFEDFEVFSEVKDLGRFRERGYKLIGISNQSGIARGIVDEGFVKEVNRVFIEQYKFDDFYYCRHHPKDFCSCRKPAPGMLYRARAEHGIDLRQSYFVGDKDADVLVGKAAGAEPIFLRNKNYDLSVADVKHIGNLSELFEIIK